MRGDCVDIPLVRGDCGSGVCIPLSIEVIVVVWLSTLSLKYEVDSCLALCLASKCKGCILLREELCILKLYLPKSSVEVPYVGSPVWTS